MQKTRRRRPRERPELPPREKKSDKYGKGLRRIRRCRNSESGTRPTSRMLFKACLSSARKCSGTRLLRKTKWQSRAKVPAYSESTFRMSDHSNSELSSASSALISCLSKSYYRSRNNKKKIIRERESYHSRSAECCVNKRQRRSRSPFLPLRHVPTHR